MSDFAARRVTMVDTQVRPNDVTSFPVIAAMLAIPREDFVPDARRAVAYSGENIDLGSGRTLLEPRTLAKMVDALALEPGDLVLDLACGLGYSSAVMAHMVQAVVAVESADDLAREAEARLSSAGIDNVAVVNGPLADGYAGQAPFDAIMINGAIDALPDALADQLKEGGRIAALFTDGRLGVVRTGIKLDGRINWRFAFNAHAPALAEFSAPQEFAL